MNHILMCRPIHFQVEYQINPWMEVGTVDQQRALREWEQLKAAYESLGVKVEVIDQEEGVPDMVFATDQGVMLDDSTFLLGRFRYPERQPETVHYRKWYEEHGYALKELPEGVFLEGGDVQWYGDKVLVGTGFRTSGETVSAVGQLADREAIELHLIDPKFYHLDTCLMVLNSDTVFYYPPAFSESSQKKLKEMVPNLIEFSLDDVLHFAANSVRVNHTVLMHTPTKSFKKAIEMLGYTSKVIDISEFIKAGGGIHCLTGDL